jgi:uncharacterized cupin superfamily protein
MAEEARLVEFNGGLVPENEGWFVVNAADALWWRSDHFGSSAVFEGRTDFPQLGFRLRVLWPGRPNGMYHSENAQEDFLVLAGECVLLIEGEERRLKAWDFVHCPAGTEHIFVGAEEPCLVLMVGARLGDEEVLHYPVSELARRYGASVEEESSNPDEVYAPFGEGKVGAIPDEALRLLRPPR